MRPILFAIMFSACAIDPQGMEPVDEGEGEEPLPELGYRHYVIDKLTLPTSMTEATQMGLDIDADGDADNKLGNVITTLSTLGIDAKATVTRSIDRGETILLARIGTNSFLDSPVATFQTYVGTDPSVAPCATESDTACRKHLDGTASFTAMAEPGGKALRGSFQSGTFYATGGELIVRVALLGSEPIDLVLINSKAELTMTTDTKVGQVKLAGAISRAEIDAKVMPAVQGNLMTGVTADCTALASPPACGCATGSDGKMAIGMFDSAPADCSISLDEVMNHSLINVLLTPDLDIGGTKALSLGVTASAVMALFTAPE